MSDTSAHITCPECNHTFTIESDILAKLNYIGQKIDLSYKVIEGAVANMASNPLLSRFVGK